MRAAGKLTRRRDRGWTVRTCSKAILGAEEIEEFEAELGTKHLPELLFGNTFLRIEHEATGVQFTFNALEALRAWLQEDLPPIRIKVAEDWQSSRTEALKEFNVKTVDYDWTFTTPFGGHCGVGGTGGSAGWEETGEKIDRELLMRREPILFYDDVTFYESELDDNGDAKLSAKLRVMPSCWYVLMRYWVRVDDILVRVRDTRYFCRLPTDFEMHDGSGPAAPAVLRETKHFEATWEDLANASDPKLLRNAHKDADASAATFESLAPDHVKHFKVEKLALDPAAP